MPVVKAINRPLHVTILGFATSLSINNAASFNAIYVGSLESGKLMQLSTCSSQLSDES